MDTMWSKVSIRNEKALVRTGNRLKEFHAVFRATMMLNNLNNPEKLTCPLPFPNLGTC